MMDIEQLGNEILAGRAITRQEAETLYNQPLDALCRKADELRTRFCGSGFDLCTIVNGKSGRCSEDCRFCAQSAFYHTGAAEYSLLSAEEIVAQARANDAQGVLRCAIVTAGKRLSDREVDALCQTIQRILRETSLSVCVSCGLLNTAQYRRLRDAGVTRAHNNLETSRRFFPSVCTTHTFEEKLEAVQAAGEAGLSVCSGGIIGLGETPEDRIDMAFTLRELGVKSVPLNLLNPIPGTPLAQNQRLSAETLCRVAAVYRFILPDAAIRLAGGRGLLPDRGRRCFQSGANAAISGDMLTTAGITTETDRRLLQELGYEIRRDNV